jgi:hypothetical protein
MGVKGWRWPTKGEAVIMGVFALLLLASNAVAVLWEGRTATGVYWAVQSLNLALLVVSLWLYRRAAKRAKPTR